jgi:leader peptidase (prepilin peptidase)/N-methyltransferase
VEWLTALLFVGSWWVGGWPAGVVWMVFAGLMVPAAFIDLDTMELPDVFTVGGFLAGIALNTLFPSAILPQGEGPAIVAHLLGLKASLVGAFFGSGLILWIGLLGEWVFRKEAMGFGDVKLMGAIGAFCGWEGSLFAIFGGSMLACLVLLFLWPFQRSGRASFSRQVPFGPALVAGALLYLLVARPHVMEYLREVRAAFSLVL